VALALAAVMAVREAWATPSKDDVEQAKRHYARGVELYKQGVDAGALAELERAYALAPNVRILYNIGLVELQLRDFAGALKTFERYLGDMGPPSAEATAARRREVEAHVAELRGQVATMVVDADVVGAEITVDDVVLGVSPLAAPVVLNPGHYRVGASAEGREPVSKVVSVVGGDAVDIHLELHRAPEPLPPPTTGPEDTQAEVAEPSRGAELPPVPRAPLGVPAATREGPRPSLWIGWTVTGSLAVGALVTGLAALGADRELSNAKADGPRSGDDLDAIARRARGLAVASDVLGGAALVAGGVTLYLALRQHAPQGGGASRAGARIDLGPSSVSLRGSF
jgi:hypothetical protein